MSLNAFYICRGSFFLVLFFFFLVLASGTHVGQSIVPWFNGCPPYLRRK